MNKLYALIVVMILSASGFSQTFTWTGGAGADHKWTTAANWSGGTGYPSTNAHSVVFNSSATVAMDAAITVKSISVTGSGSNVVIDGQAAINSIDITSGDGNAPTFTVDANSTLDLARMLVVFADNIQGTVNGTLILRGTNNSDYTFFALPTNAGNPAVFNVNGIIEDKYGTCIDNAIDDYLKFNNGSKLLFSGSAISVPVADYNPGSEVSIEGATNQNISILERDGVDKLTYNSSLQSAELQLNIPGHFVINTLNIDGTNNQTLVLISNSIVDGSSQTNFDFTVTNFTISGNSN
ncbi:MAG: hypothetical protein J7497_14565, partial [Chitinophagaceae bacterium]|nr:hypothetical protein [Chitinophagaceae bacterium]